MLRASSIYMAFAICLPFLAGCVPEPGTKAEVTSGQSAPTIDQAQAEAYDGPKARIAVARFTDKTGGGWWSGRIGDGMADQMVTALFNTNRYIVLERQTLGDVLGEQDLGASGRIRADTAAPIGQIEGAELMVVGAVTEFQGDASGGGGGAGGWGGGVLGAIAGGFRKAHMAIDVRIVDTRTSRILAATSVEGEATDVNLGGLVGGYGGSGALAAGLGGWKNTPTEKALRICIQKAVDFVVSKTPQSYYHYGSGGAVKTSAPASSSASVPSGPSGENANPGDTVIVSTSSLNVRSGPATNNPKVFGVTQGERLSVLERQGRWIRIRSASGQEGWTAGWLTVMAK